MLASVSEQLCCCCAATWPWLLTHVLGATYSEAVLARASVTGCAALLFLVLGNSSSFGVHLEEQ